MALDDCERIDWLESMVRELDLRILATGTGVELCLGRLTFPGSSLRGAIDQAIEATALRPRTIGGY